MKAIKTALDRLALLAVALLVLFVVDKMAFGGAYANALRPHGHTSAADGGVLTNLSPTGTITARAFTLPSGSTETVTAVYAVAGSTLTIGAHPTAHGAPILVVSTGPVASQGATFAGLEPSSTTIYYLHWQGAIGGAAATNTELAIEFNGDATANSMSVQKSITRGGVGTSIGDSVNAFTLSRCVITLNNGADGLQAGDTFSFDGTLSFASSSGVFKWATVTGLIHFKSTQNGTQDVGVATCEYHGSAAVTKLRLFATAAAVNWGGSAWLKMEQP